MTLDPIRRAFRLPAVRLALRTAAFASWALITVLSLVPGEDRPHTGIGGQFEHVMAYLLSALVTRLAIRRTASRAQVLGFSAASAFFEICQIWIPGRSSAVGDWLASTFGALVGVMIARAVAHLLEMRKWRALKN